MIQTLLIRWSSRQRSYFLNKGRSQVIQGFPKKKKPIYWRGLSLHWWLWRSTPQIMPNTSERNFIKWVNQVSKTCGDSQSFDGQTSSFLEGEQVEHDPEVLLNFILLRICIKHVTPYQALLKHPWWKIMDVAPQAHLTPLKKWSASAWIITASGNCAAPCCSTTGPPLGSRLVMWYK